MKLANNNRAINMAKHFMPQPICLITFLIASSLLTSARDILPREISLVKEPDENYYIVKKSPVVIVCQAKNAAEIIFNCMGTQIPPTSVEVTDVSDIDPELTQAEIEVNRADLQNNEGSFWCECSAVDVDGQVAVTSRKATISIAHLKNKFETQPKSATSTVGDEVEFECGAPEGEPKAEIMWRKDKKRLEIENNPRFVVTEKGSLLIQFVMPEDTGYYQCVARNVAGRRESEEALLSVTALAESAEPDLEIFGGVSAEKKPSGGAKLRATRQSNKTFFTTEPQEKYFITKEKPIIIDCGVVGADVLTFRCNGKRMERDRQTINQGLDATNKRAIQSQIKITYSEVQAFMAEFGDRQTYQCICVAWYQDSGVPNSWGRMDSRATNGFVHLAYLDEVFQAEPSDVIASLNTDATLACEPPRGQPSPWVYWYKDNTRLDPRSSQKYSVNDKGHLTIHNVQYEDAGAYNCQAENSVDTVKSRIGTLTVTAEAVVTTTAAPSEDDIPAFPDVIPTSPVFLRDLEAISVLGSDGTKAVVCAVVSADQVTIDCGGQRLPAEDYELKQNLHRESGKRLLHVKAVITAEKLARNPSDYFCQCIAWFLNENQEWERMAGAKGYLRPAEVTAFIKDTFKLAPSDTDADFESEAELSCQPPEGNPPPQIYWIKDGVRIDTEADANFVQNEGTLYIEYVRETDEGQYICVAENDAGRRESQPIQFTVLRKPAPPTEVTPTEVTTTEVTPTEIVDTETDMETTTFGEEVSSESEHEEHVFYQQLHDEYYILDDDEVTLHCAVINIKTLVFVCNGVALKESLTTGDSITHPVTMDTIRSNHLTITKEKFDEYNGTEPYTCLCRAVYQEEGELRTVDSSPATIHVAYMEEEFKIQPVDTEVISMGRLELQCQAPEAVPEAEISWLKDGQQVTTDSRTKIEHSGTLVIENFRVDDEGTYTCVANNSFDVRTSNDAFVAFSVTSGPGEQVTQFYTVPEFETDEPGSEPETTPSESGKQSSEIRYISKDLHSVYYLVKNKPLTITCEIYNVDYITFICGDKNVEIVETKKREEGEYLVTAVEATITVPREDVEKLPTGSKYYCQCFGHYSVPGIVEDQKIASVKALVESAYLKKNFQKQPENQTIMQGESLTIHCDPPMGNPPPKVSLTKDGENIEAIITNPTGMMYIIPEVQLEDAGEYICIAENEAGKRMSLPAYVDVKVRDDVPPMKGGIEGNECAQMLSSCSNLLPRNANHIEFCEAVPGYTACVDSYFQKCTGIINEISMNAVKMAKMDTEEKCTLKSECQKLEECRTTSNSPDLSMEDAGFSIQNLCRETSTFVQCVDENLAGCNVTLSPPEEYVRGSLADVDAWFTEFCYTVRDNKRDLEFCKDVDNCGLHLEQVAHDNSTYWCNQINSLLKCTLDATFSCGLEDVKTRLYNLRTQANEQYCTDHQVTLEPQPEVSPSTDESVSSEANPEPTATEEARDGDDGENVDQGNNENMEGGAAASKDDPDNGSPVLRISMFLATFLQLLILASLSWR